MHDEYETKAKDTILLFLGGIVALTLLIGMIWGANYLYKEYNIWASAKEGEAQLAKATYNRQIAVQEANAKAAAAIELAKAEVIRAHGVAQANKIIGASLQNNEAYLRYLWIQNLESQHNKIIYVPTEANLPILEAGRRVKNEK